MQYRSLFFATTQLRGLDCKIGTTYFGWDSCRTDICRMRPIATAKGSGSGKADRGEILERIWLSKDRDAGAEVHAPIFVRGEQTRPGCRLDLIVDWRNFLDPLLCHLHTPKINGLAVCPPRDLDLAVSLFRSFFRSGKQQWGPPRCTAAAAAAAAMREPIQQRCDACAFSSL